MIPGRIRLLRGRGEQAEKKNRGIEENGDELSGVAHPPFFLSIYIDVVGSVSCKS